MTEKDFDKMEHSPLALKKGELMQEYYKYFGRRDVFCTPLTERELPEEAAVLVDEQDDKQCLSDLIKFVVLFSSKDSPYWDDEDFDIRMEQCLKWAGIKKASRAYYHIIGNTDWYLQILAEYFIYIDHSLYEQWFSEKISFHESNAYLRRPFRDDDPEKASTAHGNISKTLTQRRLSIDKLQSELFPKNKKVARRIQEAIENKESVTGYCEIKALPVPT